MNAQRLAASPPRRLHDALAASREHDPSLSVDAQLCALALVARDIAGLHENPGAAHHGFAVMVALQSCQTRKEKHNEAI